MRLAIVCTLAIALAGVVANGCGGIADPSQNVIETFTSTVPVGGANFNQFRVSRSGEFSITLVSLNPPVSVFVAVSIGMMIGTACSVGQRNPLATAGHTVLSGPLSQPGTFCVQVEDEGFFTVPETYTVQVSHP